MGWYSPTSPSADLVDDVVCSWTARTDGTHLLVPDGCVDVLWIAGLGIRVCGPETVSWKFTLPVGTEAVGIRFRPGVVPRLLGESASAMRNQRVDLGALIGSAIDRELRDRLDNAVTDHGRQEIFENAVRRWRENRSAADPLVRGIALALARSPGTVSDVAQRSGLTERQLLRRCSDAFGYGPATLRSILRLQRFMQVAQIRPQLSLADLAATAGYSDQAHLSRNCRKISSMTPKELLASEAPRWHGASSVLGDVRNIQSKSTEDAAESAA